MNDPGLNLAHAFNYSSCAGQGAISFQDLRRRGAGCGVFCGRKGRRSRWTTCLIPGHVPLQFEKLGYRQPWIQVPTSWVYLAGKESPTCECFTLSETRGQGQGEGVSCLGMEGSGLEEALQVSQALPCPEQVRPLNLAPQAPHFPPCGPGLFKPKPLASPM